MSENNYKICPYCAEEINIDAVKCKHCMSFLKDNYINTNVDLLKQTADSIISEPQSINSGSVAKPVTSGEGGQDVLKYSIISLPIATFLCLWLPLYKMTLSYTHSINSFEVYDYSFIVDISLPITFFIISIVASIGLSFLKDNKRYIFSLCGAGLTLLMLLVVYASIHTQFSDINAHFSLLRPVTITGHMTSGFFMMVMLSVASIAVNGYGLSLSRKIG